MEERKYFILNDGRVHGPYKKDDVESTLGSFSGPLIWGRGQSEWLPPEKWNRQVKDFEANDLKAKKLNERTWKIKTPNGEMPPMSHDEMLEFLRQRTDYGDILLWTEGYNEWKEIYQIHKVMDELGVSRRAHPRVPIMGTLTCEGASGNFTCRVLSISEGGLGITEAPDVKIGEKFKTILKSPNLFAPVHSTIEVVYIGNDGYAGLKFTSIHSENKGQIIEYIKKFQENKD